MPCRRIRTRDIGVFRTHGYTVSTPRRANGCMLHGRRKVSTSTGRVLRIVSDATRCGISDATSNPTGPPMSCTMRWNRSKPSASTATTANRPKPVHV